MFTPSLTGLGERAHLVTPTTSLDTHVDDIANVLASLKPTHHFVEYYEWANSISGWSARKIASNHFPMTTMPHETADLLGEIAG